MIASVSKEQPLKTENGKTLKQEDKNAERRENWLFAHFLVFSFSLQHIFSPARFLPFSLTFLLLSSCFPDEEIPVPRPRTYHRIDFPAKEYKLFSGDCPFEFEHPAYSLVLPDSSLNAEHCWKNIVFPKLNAEINLSYKKIDREHTLEKYLEESWLLATRHVQKATGMPETPIWRDSARVYGLLFEIEGNAASNLQFYLTDSTRHFMRGALYFFTRPNYDSLAPVIDFIKKDIERMIATLRWKDARNQQRASAGAFDDSEDDEHRTPSEQKH